MVETGIIASRLAPFGAALVMAMLSHPALAADCGGVAINARFAEAVRTCAGSARQGAISYQSTAVIETPATVSVQMAGYRARLAKAARSIEGSGRAPTAALVTAVARRYRIDPHLLASMVRTESAGRMNAVSNKGALGLLQVMPGTARGLGVRDPRAMLNDPVLALSTGAAYLKQLQGRLGNNVPLVVAAYNAGPGAVAKARGIPNYRETRGYVASVMGRYAAARGAAQ